MENYPVDFLIIAIQMFLNANALLIIWNCETFEVGEKSIGIILGGWKFKKNKTEMATNISDFIFENYIL